MPVLVFREVDLIGSASDQLDWLVAFDPRTGETELILDHQIIDDDPEGQLDYAQALDAARAPPPADRPFRAVVVARELGGLRAHPPILPGRRKPSRRDMWLAAEVPMQPAVQPLGQRPEVVLTHFPMRVTAIGPQSLELATEIGDLDEIVLELRVLSLTGSGSPDVTVQIETGMQVESSVGWVSAGAFTRAVTAPATQVRSFGRLLRYVRWNVSGLSGTSPSATFFLSGVGRRWSKETSGSALGGDSR